MDTSLLPLTYLLPIGLVFIAWGGVLSPRLREAALASLVIAVAAIAAYVGFGFALQFGGIGLSPDAPIGLRALDKAWSPVAGSRWWFVGLEGFFATGQGEASGLALVETLALHRLPLAIAAGLIPVAVLGDRVHRIIMIGAGIVAATVVFPLVGAWVWGGGWLAALGSTLNLGHGAIDVAGSGIVYAASACVALVALRWFGLPIDSPDRAAALPSLRQPIFLAAGVALFGAGWSAWAVSDPLLSAHATIDFSSVAGVGGLSALSGLVAAGVYAWLVTSRLSLLMMLRGALAGWVAAGAIAWFVPAAAAGIVGAGAGLIAVVGQHLVDHVWKMDDRSGLLAAGGLAGTWGALALGLFADGAFGRGWNGVAANGVGGLLAGDPGQLTAQIALLGATGLLGVCATALALFPLSILARREQRTGQVGDPIAVDNAGTSMAQLNADGPD